MKVVLQNLTKIFPSRNKKSNEEVVAVNGALFHKALQGGCYAERIVDGAERVDVDVHHGSAHA